MRKALKESALYYLTTQIWVSNIKGVPFGESNMYHGLRDRADLEKISTNGFLKGYFSSEELVAAHVAGIDQIVFKLKDVVPFKNFFKVSRYNYQGIETLQHELIPGKMIPFDSLEIIPRSEVLKWQDQADTLIKEKRKCRAR